MPVYISEARMKRFFSSRRALIYSISFSVLGTIAIAVSFWRITREAGYTLYLFSGGAGALALSGIILFVNYFMRPSDQEYDAWVNDHMELFLKNVLNELGIDEREVQTNPYLPGPLVLRGIVVPGTERAKERYNNEVYLRRGRDGYIRSSINTLLYIFPLKDHIAAFYSDLNAIRQSLRYQETDHYYYRHIVGLSADKRGRPFDFTYARVKLCFQSFYLRASSGDSIGTDILVGIRENGVFIASDPKVDNVVSSLLLFLRDKELTV